MSFHVPEDYRLRNAGHWSSTVADGNNGAFLLPSTSAVVLRIIASDGGGWEHVSVSTEQRIPTWGEMCFVKDTFWDVEDCVMQLHPPRSEYINCHPYTLHLWRPIGALIPQPPSIMVGINKETP